jgi:hypothetical protein
MLTRGHFAPAYSSQVPPPVIRSGVVKVESHKGIPQTWAVSRPTAAPSPHGAPLYLGLSPYQYAPHNHLVRGTGFELGMAVPKLEADPSDPTTWQRPYRFS